MTIDYLIIGQGISGTWLSYYIKKQGRSVMVIDNNDLNASSRLAAGVINPVTGRRHVEVWKADEILPFAREAYAQLGEEIGAKVFTEKTLIDFFPSPQMRLSFMQRVNEKQDYVFLHDNSHIFSEHFNYDFGSGEIKPVYIASLEKLLPLWRQELTRSGQLLEEEFEYAAMTLDKDRVIYKNINAGHIIFCDGNQSANSPLFKNLPFAPNKGQVLITEIPALPIEHVYKKGMVLVPLSEKGLWWVGSDYNWEFDNVEPTKEFRERTESLLKHWLKIPFKIIDHLAGIRPATLERRPFVGLHPVHKQVGILNGMGTKGCSLAPFFAKQLSDHLYLQQPLSPEADIKRFSNILSRE